MAIIEWFYDLILLSINFAISNNKIQFLRWIKYEGKKIVVPMTVAKIPLNEGAST